MSAKQRFRKLELRSYVESFLDRGLRDDGRGMSETRATSLQLGVISTADGSAMAKQGQTTILATVKAEIAEPTLLRSDRGVLIVSVESFSKQQNEFEEEMQEQIQTILSQLAERSGLVPLESLCILKGSWVWALYCDLQVLDSDGAVLDTSLTALTAALHSCTLPSVQLSQTGLELEGAESGKKPTLELNPESRTRLQSREFPISLTFTSYQTEGAGVIKVVSDPSREESSALGEDALSVLVSESGLCGLHSFSSSALLSSPPLLEECIRLATDRRLQIIRLIQEALAISSNDVKYAIVDVETVAHSNAE